MARAKDKGRPTASLDYPRVGKVGEVKALKISAHSRPTSATKCGGFPSF